MARVSEVDVHTHRQPSAPVDNSFVERWSPRALSGEPISQEQMDSLLEAARWAPSSNNNQPWRLVYAHRDTPAWQGFVDLMVPFNQEWANKAAVLIVVCSKNTFDHNGAPSLTHSFDTGAAWVSLALQATSMGLVAHGMQGFDYERAAALVGLPPDHTVEALVAVGHPGKVADLPERLAAREKPSQRKPLSEISFEGGFPR